MLFCAFGNRSNPGDAKILTEQWDWAANWENQVKVIGIKEVNEPKSQWVEWSIQVYAKFPWLMASVRKKKTGKERLTFLRKDEEEEELQT